jgi:hypothetical protein
MALLLPQELQTASGGNATVAIALDNGIFIAAASQVR